MLSGLTCIQNCWCVYWTLYVLTIITCLQRSVLTIITCLQRSVLTIITCLQRSVLTIITCLQRSVLTIITCLQRSLLTIITCLQRSLCTHCSFAGCTWTIFQQCHSKIMKASLFGIHDQNNIYKLEYVSNFGLFWPGVAGVLIQLYTSHGLSLNVHVNKLMKSSFQLQTLLFIT